MKHLLSILSMGLLLISMEVSASTAGKNPDEIFKVCNKDFLDKVIEICGGWVWKSEIPSPRDIPQEAPKMEDLKKVLMGLVKDGIHQINQYDGKQFFPDKEKQDEQKSGNISEIVQARVMQPTLLTDSVQRELTRRQVVLSDKCCNTGCKYQELAILCEP